jgi:DNA-binding MarR family transcriptional regulator
MSRRAQGIPRRTTAPAAVARSGLRLSILFDVFALSQQVKTLLQLAMHDAGLRADEYAAYSVVIESGQITMTGMARALGMPVTTAADYVQAMLARGHVRKDAHPGDQRAYLLTLTTAGVRAQRKASRSFERAYAALARELPPLDEGEARAVLQQLAACAGRAAGGLSHPAGG